MNTFHLHHGGVDSRRWTSFNHRPSSAAFYARLASPAPPPPPPPPPRPPSSSSSIQTSFPALDDVDLVAAVVPPVTVVLEGRSICHRIYLQSHASYQSLAKALRQMFADGGTAADLAEHELDLSNAVPGHLIAYEDMENDLLLAGDLNWKFCARGQKNLDFAGKEELKEGERRVIDREAAGPW